MAVALERLTRSKWRVAIVAVVIIAVVAVFATRGNAAEDGSYRTALVDTGDVTQTLAASGSIESASRYDLTFQVAGTVDAVDVAEGDTVEAGQTLATLDQSDLEEAVESAEDALSQAEQTLADDLDAQSSGSTSSTSSSSGGSGPSGSQGSGSQGSGNAGNNGGSGSAGSDNGNTTSPEIEAAEQAVRDAQDALLAQYDVATAALENAKTKQTDAQTICAAFTALDPADDTAADALAACQTATDDALTAQQDSADAQADLMIAATALNDAVSDLLAAIDGTSSAAPAAYQSAKREATIVLAAYQTSRVATATDDMGGGGASGSSGASNSVPSAGDILADKADVTAAEAALEVAKAQLEFATISSPVAGTVVSVGLAEGDSVSAADTTTAITIVADNTYVVNLAVSLTQARMLEVGQPATLTLLSDNQQVEGTVSSVSTVNSGNSFSQTYAVKIAVPDPGFEIRIGTATRMAITVADATGVLVVPTSAVSDATGEATVQVIGEDGTPQVVNVTTGAVGAAYTEITDGLEKGQQVVLADLAFELSSDDDSSSTGGLLSGLDDSSDEQQQGPGGGNFQPPGDFQGGGGFGGPPSG
ncbi:efflux RND transporter periplasmic adaptor subunit [Demequina sp.]|uniref:efflux RND transporter periplasmic adaptor subunit n=1 Tax=Demequina sp. TaxID=2050685 RepID=UPI003D14CEDB